MLSDQNNARLALATAQYNLSRVDCLLAEARIAIAKNEIKSTETPVETVTKTTAKPKMKVKAQTITPPGIISVDDIKKLVRTKINDGIPKEKLKAILTKLNYEQIIDLDEVARIKFYKLVEVL